MLEAEIAHQGTDDTVDATAASLARDDIEQLIAIVDVAGRVGHHQPVTIAIESDAEIGPVLEYGTAEVFRRLWRRPDR